MESTHHSDESITRDDDQNESDLIDNLRRIQKIDQGKPPYTNNTCRNEEKSFIK